MSTDTDRSSFYYCEQCFTIHSLLRQMERIDGDLECPSCGGEWKLNRGQIRHTVSIKLQQYRRLAKELDILQEEESEPPTRGFV